MADICAFVVCDTVTEFPGPNGQQVMQINNPIHVLRPFKIPGFISFAIVFGLTKLNNSMEFMLELIISAPSGTIAYQIQAPLRRPEQELDNPRKLPVEHQGLFLNVDVRNLVIKEQGYYNFKLKLNGETAISSDILAYPLELDD